MVKGFFNWTAEDAIRFLRKSFVLCWAFRWLTKASMLGSSVSGTLTVEDKRLKFSVNLPFAAIFFMDEIELAIRKKAKSLLE